MAIPHYEYRTFCTGYPTRELKMSDEYIHYSLTFALRYREGKVLKLWWVKWVFPQAISLTISLAQQLSCRHYYETYLGNVLFLILPGTHSTKNFLIWDQDIDVIVIILKKWIERSSISIHCHHHHHHVSVLLGLQLVASIVHTAPFLYLAGGRMRFLSFGKYRQPTGNKMAL